MQSPRLGAKRPFRVATTSMGVPKGVLNSFEVIQPVANIWDLCAINQPQQYGIPWKSNRSRIRDEEQATVS